MSITIAARFTFKKLALVATASLIGAAPAWAVKSTNEADQYPQRPITIIIPFGAGGATDLTARTVGKLLGESLGQPVIFENRAGGNSIPGTLALKGAKPDGYTLAITSNHFVANPLISDSARYNPFTDFTHVGIVGSSPIVISANHVNSIEDIAELRSPVKTKNLAYATGGNGTPQHLVGAILDKKVNYGMVHIPYKGGGQATADVVAGHVQLLIAALPPALPFIKDNKLKPLAVAGNKRSEFLPDTPTLQEKGYAGIDTSVWFALVAPAGTPSAISKKLNARLNEVLQRPETVKVLAVQGVEPGAGDTTAATAFLLKEQNFIAQVINDVKPSFE